MSIELVREFVDVGIVKFGDFKLKSGLNSPIYFDFRILVSHPRLLEKTADALFKKARDDHVEFNTLCGVPYTSLPIATSAAIKYNIPMILRRKEVKDHGTGKIVDGFHDEKTICLIFEDVVTTGSSIIETVKVLRLENIKVLDTIAILNREQGGNEALENENIYFHHLFTITDFIRISLLLNKIPENVKSILPSLTKEPADNDSPQLKRRLTIEDRYQCATHPFTKKLLKIITVKQTNLCVAADLIKCNEIIDLVEKVGEHICVLKLHLDIIEDFCQEFVTKIKLLSEVHNFLIFEDRKYSDIGNTVSMQFHDGIYQVSSFADLVNAHVISGPSIITGLKTNLKKEEFKCHACLLVAEMSCKGNIMDYKFIEASKNIARANPDFVVGFISQHQFDHSSQLIQFTPGVSISKAADDLGQQYVSPDIAIKNGADVIIVGRSITNAADPNKEAKLYKEVCYKALCEN